MYSVLHGAPGGGLRMTVVPPKLEAYRNVLEKSLLGVSPLTAEEVQALAPHLEGEEVINRFEARQLIVLPGAWRLKTHWCLCTAASPLGRIPLYKLEVCRAPQARQLLAKVVLNREAYDALRYSFIQWGEHLLPFEADIERVMFTLVDTSSPHLGLSPRRMTAISALTSGLATSRRPTFHNPTLQILSHSYEYADKPLRELRYCAQCGGYLGEHLTCSHEARQRPESKMWPLPGEVIQLFRTVHQFSFNPFFWWD